MEREIFFLPFQLLIDFVIGGDRSSYVAKRETETALDSVMNGNFQSSLAFSHENEKMKLETKK